MTNLDYLGYSNDLVALRDFLEEFDWSDTQLKPEEFSTRLIEIIDAFLADPPNTRKIGSFYRGLYSNGSLSPVGELKNIQYVYCQGERVYLYTLLIKEIEGCVFDIIVPPFEGAMK